VRALLIAGSLALLAGAALWFAGARTPRTSPPNAGLALVRAREIPAAIAALRRAAELAPRDGRYAAVLAVALHDTGDAEGACAALERALTERPRDAALRDLLRAYENR
jgi:Flp pilus assembly protein TadD